jgi:hypothetical protein
VGVSRTESNQRLHRKQRAGGLFHRCTQQGE